MQNDAEQLDEMIVDVKNGSGRIAGQKEGVVTPDPAVLAQKPVGDPDPDEVQRVVERRDRFLAQDDPGRNDRHGQNEMDRENGREDGCGLHDRESVAREGATP